MQILNQNCALAVLHAGAHKKPGSMSIAGEPRIADPVGSIALRLRKLLDKLVDGDADAVRIRRELHQLQSDKAALKIQIEELSRLHVEARHDAFHDELTGLPNRKRLRDRFNVATDYGERRHQQVVLLFFDLDNFKHVNDDFGHSAGDQVLQVVATRLQAAIRTTDTACRYGGDEFVILLTDIDAATGAAEAATNICERLAEQYQVGGKHIDLRASVGIAIYPDDGQNWEDLVHHADTEMYRLRARCRQHSPTATARSV